jgi:hypothetical protein
MRMKVQARAWRGAGPGAWTRAGLCALALAAPAHRPAGAAEDVTRPAGDDLLARVDRLEERLLQLTPELRDLDISVLNLTLPDDQSRHLFAPTVTWTDLAPGALAPYDAAEGLASIHAWAIGSGARTEPVEAMQLWRPFLGSVDFFTFAHFKLYRGRFQDAQETVYVGDVRFDGNARLTSGPRATVEAKMEVEWRKTGADASAPWRIHRWDTKSFTVTQSARALFAEVLDEALPDVDARRRARQSLHEQMVVARMQDPKTPPPHKYFQFQSLNRHPGLAVADVDADGFDDLYVMERQGTNLLLRNRGDGTFEEIAARLGLDVTDHTSCALFADFDNDGDLDVFLGRTLAPSQYRVNENGRFVQRTDLLAAHLPALVSSISAADYDQDGLLDVYFSTYAIDADLQEDFLPPGIFQNLQRRWRRGANLFKERPGPPNILLHNAGDGRFELAPTAAPLAVWRNTFQSTWSDYDDDGDMDVYLANDFAPNNLLRNDGGGKFTDVTAETGTADLGFGMGASWGDYDRDGREDLYVTNMYSSAGRRITEALGEAGRDLAPMARGNSLFRNLPARFERVSGLEPPALTVERAGWGWGGQFVDVDNDGWLDIHALNGYYTAPEVPGTRPDL